MSNIHLHGNRTRYFTCDTSWENNTQQNIYEQQDPEKKKMCIYQNEGLKDHTCSPSIYKAASSLAKCKIGCAVPVFTHALVPFEKKTPTLLQHMSPVN